jgi:hypothetical protein
MTEEGGAMNTRRRSGDKPLLGEILLERGLITKENLDQALRVQSGGLRRVGYLLVKMKFISDVQLLDAISTQLGIPIVQVESEIRPEVRGLLPRHLCRRFTVLPLALEEHNVVRLAMVDPLDDVAIREVENFTGLAVRPVLANVHEIRHAIERHVPLSRQDFFNPEVYKIVAKVSATAAVVLLLLVGFLGYQAIRLDQQGKITKVKDSVIYENHDLQVDVRTGDGSFYLGGRGAHTDGHFGVRFANADGLSLFLRSQQSQLSDDQREWLDWVLTHLPQGVPGPSGELPSRAAGKQRQNSPG